MRASQLYPSKYLKASDLVDPKSEEYHDKSVTIKELVVEPVGQKGDRKPILYFEETDKGLPMNKTRLDAVIQQLGEETDDWTGQVVTLTTGTESYNGQTYDVVVIKSRPRKVKAVAGATKKADDDGFDPDKIPF